MAENVILSRSNRLKHAICSILLSAFAFAAGFLVLFLTFWFTYAILWFGMLGISAASELLFDKRLALTHVWRLILSSIFIVLLFIGNARTDREYLGDYPRRNYRGIGIGTQAGVAGALLSLLAYPGASTRMISDLLFSGPRLVVYACRTAVHPFSKRND
jgi:hypothetical protein